ncbi:MAG: AAA family ATPase [Butyrivibrio sp.]
MDNYVITVGREYGSAGRQIAMQLAKELGIKCYDKELLAYAAKESGLAEELFVNNDEKPTNSFLYSLVMDTYSVGYPSSSYMDVPISQKVFMAQYDAIKKLAEEESCIIVGRCADYALKDNPRCISVFIKAAMDAKIKRIMRIYDYTESKARDLIIKTDKKRSSYYNFYSNKKWADSRSYDLCLDSSILGIDGTVKMIREYMDLRFSLPAVKEI